LTGRWTTASLAERAARFFIGLACRQLPRKVRQERYREWTAELPAIAADSSVRSSFRRAVRIVHFAAGTYRSAVPPGKLRKQLILALVILEVVAWDSWRLATHFSWWSFPVGLAVTGVLWGCSSLGGMSEWRRGLLAALALIGIGAAVIFVAGWEGQFIMSNGVSLALFFSLGGVLFRRHRRVRQRA
jgi:hypothetical protein